MNLAKGLAFLAHLIIFPSSFAIPAGRPTLGPGMVLAAVSYLQFFAVFRGGRLPCRAAGIPGPANPFPATNWSVVDASIASHASQGVGDVQAGRADQDNEQGRKNEDDHRHREHGR